MLTYHYTYHTAFFRLELIQFHFVLIIAFKYLPSTKMTRLIAVGDVCWTQFVLVKSLTPTALSPNAVTFLTNQKLRKLSCRCKARCNRFCPNQSIVQTCHFSLWPNFSLIWTWMNISFIKRQWFLFRLGSKFSFIQIDGFEFFTTFFLGINNNPYHWMTSYKP